MCRARILIYQTIWVQIFFRMAVTSTIIRLGYHSRIRGRSMQEI